MPDQNSLELVYDVSRDLIDSFEEAWSKGALDEQSIEVLSACYSVCDYGQRPQERSIAIGRCRFFFLCLFSFFLKESYDRRTVKIRSEFPSTDTLFPLRDLIAETSSRFKEINSVVFKELIFQLLDGIAIFHRSLYCLAQRGKLCLKCRLLLSIKRRGFILRLFFKRGLSSSCCPILAISNSNFSRREKIDLI